MSCIIGIRDSAESSRSRYGEEENWTGDSIIVVTDDDM